MELEFETIATAIGIIIFASFVIYMTIMSFAKKIIDEEARDV